MQLSGNQAKEKSLKIPLNLNCISSRLIDHGSRLQLPLKATAAAKTMPSERQWTRGYGKTQGHYYRVVKAKAVAISHWQEKGKNGALKLFFPESKMNNLTAPEKTWP